MPATPTLEPDYYLHNFLLVLDTVQQRDPHLFSPDEHAIFARFRQLERPERCLYVRLFNRRGPYFRLDKLQYAELPNPHATAQTLTDAGFARCYPTPTAVLDDPLDLPAALDTFTVPELKAIARPLGLKGSDRASLLLSLLELPTSLLSEQLLAVAPLVTLRELRLFACVQRLFFLNEWQDASTLVTSELALIRYPETPCLRSRPVFETRAELDAWLLADVLQQQLHQALLEGRPEDADRLGEQALANFSALPPGRGDFLERFTARDVLARTSLSWLQARETSLGREVAAQLYTRMLDAHLPARMRGTAWQRLALHWEQLGWLEAALGACEQGLSEPQLPQYARLELLRRFERLRLRLTRHATQLAKKSRSHEPSPVLVPPSLVPPSLVPPSLVPPSLVPPSLVSPNGLLTPPPEAELERLSQLEALAAPQREVMVRRPLLHSSVGARMKFASETGDGLAVEDLALHAYRAAGAEGLYTENGFFTTLTTLLCWDIFFAPVPDVFQSRYQDAPLDLNQEGFYERRRPWIEARLQTLEANQLELLAHHHQRYFGLSARGVLWDAFPLPVLEQGARALGGKALAGILRFLLEDHRTRRRGFPDLLLWQSLALSTSGSPQTIQSYWGEEGYDIPASVWFAEVKSPRDRLSPEQRAWMSLLRSLGLHVEVCRIAETVSSPSR